MRFVRLCLLLALVAPAAIGSAAILEAPAAPGPAVRPYVALDAPSFAIVHVRLIDGQGGAPREDMSVVVRDGKIAEIGPAAATPPGAARVVDGRGLSLLPGLVGMHDHMYYIARPDLDAEGASLPPLVVPQMTFSSPRLYLAAGVTTLRTTGSVEPYADLNMKRLIDRGELPGPHMDVTGPYLEGPGSPFIQMHQLRDAEDARAAVAFWAEQGVTSFKAYMNITRAELGAAIQEAHRRGLKLTGHLCSVTYPEALALGIDDLEHGFYVNTELDPGKAPDLCPRTVGRPTLLAMTPERDAARSLIADLVSRRVALTSTLPVFEQSVAGHAPLTARMTEVLTPEARSAYLYARNRVEAAPEAAKREAALAFAHELELERAFVKAGGLLLAGPDPTGNGGVVPGFGDQRELELLVEAGFTPLEAIRIGTLNGARYLGLDRRIGSIEVGKDADLILVNGDPSRAISDIEKVSMVVKDGVGYDPRALLDTVRGRYGEY